MRREVTMYMHVKETHMDRYVDPEKLVGEIKELCPSLTDMYWDKYEHCFIVPLDLTDDAQVLDYQRLQIILKRIVE